MLLWTLWCMSLFELVFLFFSDIYAGVELLGHMVVLFLVFWETSILFSTVAAPIYIPTSSVWGFPFLYTYLFFKPAVLNFLAPGTSFVEDNFSTDGRGSGGWFRRMVQAVMRAMRGSRWSTAHSPTTHLLPCSPVPNRPRSSPGVGDPCFKPLTSWDFCYSCLASTLTNAHRKALLPLSLLETGEKHKLWSIDGHRCMETLFLMQRE